MFTDTTLTLIFVLTLIDAIVMVTILGNSSVLCDLNRHRSHEQYLRHQHLFSRHSYLFSSA